MSDQATTSPSTRRVARTRGAASGVLLVLLGAWAGLAPFIGPLFDFGFTPNKSWHWTAARGWYEVAPGAAIVVGGLLLLAGTSRVTTALGAWLGILAGGWLVVGPAISGEMTLGSLGTPLGDNGGVRALEQMTFFFLLGAVVIFLAAAAFGRLSVVTVRDVRVAEQREAARLEAEQAAEREAIEREAIERESYEREVQQRRAAEREAYERQTAEREAAERETAEREAAERAAAERKAAERQAAERQTGERDTAGASAFDGRSQDVEPAAQRDAGQVRPYDQRPNETQQLNETQQPYGQPYGQQQPPYAQPADEPSGWNTQNPPQR